MDNTFNDFDYVNLNEIDPAQALLPEAMYTFKIVKAGITEGISKVNGNPYQRIDFTFAVQDDEHFAGRRMFTTLFPNENTMKQLRRLMDVTGVQQAPDTTLREWLAELATIQPTFKTLVKHRLDVDKQGTARTTDYKGDPATLANVDMWRVTPA